MKFLAIDTSGKYLSVVAYRDGAVEKVFENDCALKHSIVLMEKIDDVFARAHMCAKECDFFAVAVGPGSFTGIRIGISTVKGLCLACEKPALAVTSLDCLAYNEESGKRVLALSDAGRGELYACAYEGGKPVFPPAIFSREKVQALTEEGYRPLAAEPLFPGCLCADPCEGLLRAVLAGAEGATAAEGLHALYLRKSSAEENRK